LEELKSRTLSRGAGVFEKWSPIRAPSPMVCLETTPPRSESVWEEESST